MNIGGTRGYICGLNIVIRSFLADLRFPVVQNMKATALAGLAVCAALPVALAQTQSTNWTIISTFQGIAIAVDQLNASTGFVGKSPAPRSVSLIASHTGQSEPSP